MRKANIPDLPKLENGLPDLTNKEIELLADHMALEFCPDIVDNPQPLDVDLFIEFLGFTLDYRYLSHCQCYLGVTVFRKMKFPTFNMSTFKPELTCVPANTIIIDEGLYQQMETDGHEGRYRFTEAHECGHAIMHPDFYARQAKSIQAAQHSLAAYHSGECQSALPVLSDSDLAERQANHFASCLLMPRSSILNLLERLVNPMYWEDIDIIQLVKETYNVSWPSAFYRLKQLGWLTTEMEEFDWDALTT